MPIRLAPTRSRWRVLSRLSETTPGTPAVPISYPLSVPAGLVPASFVLRACDIVGASTSPFTASQQVYRHQGQYWEADVAYPPLTRAQAYSLIGVLDQAKGKFGTIIFGDPVHVRPLGSGAGTPKVNGTNALRSETLATKGWTPGSLVLKAGDLFQLGTGLTTRLYRNLIDATADGSGNCTLDIWPALRVQAVNNDDITVVNPKGLWRLTSNHRDYAIQVGQFYNISFQLREAL